MVGTCLRAPSEEGGTGDLHLGGVLEGGEGAPGGLRGPVTPGARASGLSPASQACPMCPQAVIKVTQVLQISAAEVTFPPGTQGGTERACPSLRAKEGAGGDNMPVLRACHRAQRLLWCAASIHPKAQLSPSPLCRGRQLERHHCC